MASCGLALMACPCGADSNCAFVLSSAAVESAARFEVVLRSARWAGSNRGEDSFSLLKTLHGDATDLEAAIDAMEVIEQ